MKTDKNILIAFILNLVFSAIEFAGGIFTGSIAIISDALHDFGDAFSIGISFAFEKKSKKTPDSAYTYGYLGYSVLGGAITTLVLLLGSGVVIYNAVSRIITPAHINYDGMLVLALIGLSVNSLAAYFTHGGRSVNQKAVNLHMLEDTLGWLVILIGALVMRFTDFYLLDPILSVFVALFILVGSLRNLKEILDIFLVKKPSRIETEELKEHILKIEGVADVHHIHLWTIDGDSILATLHIVVNEYSSKIKNAVRAEMQERGISHITLEMEEVGEECADRECFALGNKNRCTHRHSHHSHSHGRHSHHSHRHSH